jgi:FkbM family methyltransferase
MGKINHLSEMEKQEIVFEYLKNGVSDKTLNKALLLDLITTIADNNRADSKFPSLSAISNDFVGMSILVNGYHERDLLEFLGKEVYAKIKSGIAIDIGAFIGTHSLHMAQYFDHVISFEPNPVVYKLFEANRMDGGYKNIYSYNFGLSGTEQYLPYYKYTEGNLGRNKFQYDDSTPEDNFAKVGDLLVKEGNAAIAEIMKSKNLALPVKLIKIDTEGHELSVLEGISEVIKSNKPVIIFESLGIKDTTRLLDYLKLLGYTEFIELQEHHPIKPRKITEIEEKFYPLILAGTNAIEFSPS